MLRLLAAGAAVGLGAATLNETLVLIASLAAAVAGVIYLWQRVVRPLVGLVKELIALLHVLGNLQEWCAGVDMRLSGLESFLHGEDPRPPDD